VVITAPTLKKYDIVILTTDHSKFKYNFIAKNSKLVFDTRNAFAVHGIKGANIVKL
jgi:UDP-N-acetyl-D-glucosamine dehydrogenase